MRSFCITNLRTPGFYRQRMTVRARFPSTLLIRTISMGCKLVHSPQYTSAKGLKKKHEKTLARLFDCMRYYLLL